MYWLAGCRATIQQQFLVGVPYVLVTPILYPSPWWVYTALVIFDYLNVDFMHLNVSWRARWAEWLIVMPRYHHIHHSSNPRPLQL
jgi:sterol desaturase/sphingolipid hydroxylase (fatty acid hydroxylase superfamily)